MAKCVAADDYPIGVPAQVAEAVLRQIDQPWGTEAMAATHVPSRPSDVRFRSWFAKVIPRVRPAWWWDASYQGER